MRDRGPARARPPVAPWHDGRPQPARRWRLRVAVGCCAAATLSGLVACASAPPVPAALDAPESRSALQSSPARPAHGSRPVPPDARGTSTAAREAFVSHAVTVLNRTARTLDADALRGISAPQCRPCVSVRSFVERIGRQGGRIEGGAWRVLDTVGLTTGSDRFRQVNVAVGYGPQTVHERPGAPPRHYGAGKAFFTFDIGRHEGRWVILSIRGGQP